MGLELTLETVDRVAVVAGVRGERVFPLGSSVLQASSATSQSRGKRRIASIVTKVEPNDQVCGSQRAPASTFLAMTIRWI